MCWYIALAVRDKKFTQEFLTGFQVSENNNKALVKAVPDGFSWLWVTNGGCSCDLTRLNLEDLETAIDRAQGKLKQKNQKRGWTKNKVNYEIEQLQKLYQNYPCGLKALLYDTLKTIVNKQGQCFLIVSYTTDFDFKYEFTILGSEDFYFISETDKPSTIKGNVLYKMKLEKR